MNDNSPSVVPSLFGTVLRAAGSAIGGYLIGKGYITAEQAPELGGAALTLIVAVWGLYSKLRAHSTLKAAIAAPAQ